MVRSLCLSFNLQQARIWSSELWNYCNVICFERACFVWLWNKILLMHIVFFWLDALDARNLCRLLPCSFVWRNYFLVKMWRRCTRRAPRFSPCLLLFPGFLCSFRSSTRRCWSGWERSRTSSINKSLHHLDEKCPVTDLSRFHNYFGLIQLVSSLHQWNHSVLMTSAIYNFLLSSCR